MDFDGMDVGAQNSQSEKTKTVDMKTETKTGNEIRLHESISLLKAFIHTISGKENVSETPETNPKDLVDKMREIVFNTFDENEKSTDKTHLEMLAKKQNRQLKELPGLPQLTEERTVEQELAFLTTLVSNIHEVQNGSSLGITPNMSLELNCMDCSMSTWTMIHEAKKVGLNIEFGSPIGHAVGIVELSNGKIYYADGQKGFIEEINTNVVVLPHGGKIIEIVNFSNIQDRQKEHNGNKEFFPQYVYVDPQGGVSATLSNLDSMLYKQYTGEITDEMRKKYSPGYVSEVEVLLKYAKDFQKETYVVGQDVVDSLMWTEKVNLSPEDEIKIKQTRLDDIRDIMFPDWKLFMESKQYNSDDMRRSGQSSIY